jgi:predicted O-methyltransferase YrrM
MLNSIQFAINYLIYFFTAGTRHSVHSPFVYDFVCRVLNVRKTKPMYHEFELVRSRMMKSKSVIELLPLGASPDKQSKKVPLSAVARRSAKSARYAELLERICDYFQPQYAIEIGTSLGISAMYQASALREGFLYTLEGNPDSAKVASFNFEKLGFQNIQLIEGNFDQQLPVLVQQIPRIDYVFFDGNHSLEATLHYFELCLQKAHTGSVFVFDDIRWSDDMFLAWSKIKNHPAVTVTIDVYAMGIVFFRKEQEKEHFTIRF